MDANLTTTPIQKFYANQNIFITGGTGFLGRVLIEKLLRSCPDLASIYVLIRNKKGKNLQARFDELFEDQLFDRVRQEQPKFRHKLVGIGGDCSLPDLGISFQDRQLLINEVSVVFHVAATVRFDEKLKMAVAINVRGPQDIIQLAKQMPKLKSLIHVSTAYSNAPFQTIEERYYPSPIDPRKLISFVEAVPDRILDNITSTLLDKWPNTYTYTKAVAEELVRQECCAMPVGVFRPAIVVSTYREPIKAWINNLYGPTGVCAGAGTGVLHVLHCDARANANVLPVDMCVNALIATAWEINKKFNEQKQNSLTITDGATLSSEPPIYHYESSNDNPIDWGTFMTLTEKNGLNLPSAKALWYYSLTLQANYFLYFLTTIFLHIFPALLVDGVLVLLGKSPKMLKVYKKIHKFTAVISYFSTRNWIFKSYRVNEMLTNMDVEDKKLFFCDLKQLNWHEFFQTYIVGIRVYLIQDPLDTMKEARIKWNRLYWCHTAVKATVLYIFIRSPSGRRTDYLGWDEYFVAMLILTSKYETETCDKNTALLINENRVIVALTCDKTTDNTTIPAEVAVINFATARQISIKECTIYTMNYPTETVAKVLAKNHVGKVIYVHGQHSNNIENILKTGNVTIKRFETEKKTVDLSFAKP